MLYKLQVPRTAHYYIQLPTREVKSILYVLHGYGQNADSFLNEFSTLKEHGVLVVAPEALSKFYNKKREAVSNWMSSRHRLDEIADYKNYLHLLRETIEKKYEVKKIGFLGFSQGVSTCLRWLSLYEESYTCFLCSGSVPPELNPKDFEYAKHSFHYFFGDQDPLLSIDQAHGQVELLSKLNQKVNLHPFKGSHEISDNCIEELFNWAQA